MLANRIEDCNGNVWHRRDDWWFMDDGWFGFTVHDLVTIYGPLYLYLEEVDNA